MCSDRLTEMHEVMKDPLRQKIMLKLGQHNNQNFDELYKSLKTTNTSELSNQLNILQEMKVEGEYLVTKQENAYTLTEKGHEVLTKSITFPEIATGSYREKMLGESAQLKQSIPKPKWFTPYWIALFVSTIILGSIIVPIFANQSLDRAISYTIIALMILGLGYYARIKTSITLNKLVYIGLVGSFIGCVLWFAGLFIALTMLPQPNTEATENARFIVLTTMSFTVGPIVGYFIGKMRNFKGPEQYSP